MDTGNALVPAEAGVAAHPLLDGVFRPEVDEWWWLEVIAQPVKIDDPVHTTVLIDSLDMLVRWRSGALLIEYSHGLGSVLHTPSHFYFKPEGIVGAVDAASRKRFAADHMGLTMIEIRELERSGVFEEGSSTLLMSHSYSMFRALVNFIRAKRRHTGRW